MKWVCLTCSSVNDDKDDCCFVCGAERAADSTGAGASPSDEGTVSCPVAASSPSVSDGAKKDGAAAPSVWRVLTSSLKGLFSHGGKKPKETKTPSSETPSEMPSETPADVTGTYAAPWEEHSVVFDMETIRGKGYVRSERQTMDGVRGYRFYDAVGGSRFYRIEMLIVLKLARER